MAKKAWQRPAKALAVHELRANSTDVTMTSRPASPDPLEKQRRQSTPTPTATRERRLTRGYSRLHTVAIASQFLSPPRSPAGKKRTNTAQVVAVTKHEAERDEGETEEDPIQEVQLEERETLYQINPHWGGAQPFSVNGAHILVLINNQKPYVKQRRDKKRKGKGYHEATWQVLEWIVDGHNNMTTRCKSYDNEVAAKAALVVTQRRWKPLRWEVTVADYLAVNKKVKWYCKMMACDAITFHPSQPDSTLLDILTALLGEVPSTGQLHYMAWWLGMWLADGSSHSAVIYQGGALPPDPHSHQQIFHRLHEYSLLYPRDRRVHQALHRVSTAGRRLYAFQLPTDTVAHRVLVAYGLISNKHVPQGLMCDSVDVRRLLLAGILDGDGYYVRHHNKYELPARSENVCAGYKELAATLGLRNSKVHEHEQTDEETGEVYSGQRVNLSGDMWSVAQHCVATYKRCPHPGTPGYTRTNKHSRCWGFSVEEVEPADYCGFAVDGANKRFLLADYTVTHNVSQCSHIWRS